MEDADARTGQAPGGRLTRLIAGRRTAWLVALLPLLLGVLMLGLVGEGERTRTDVDALPAGQDSTYATELQEQLPDEGASSAVVVFSASGGGELDAATLKQLRGIASDVKAAPVGPDGPLQVSEDGTAAIAIVPVKATTSDENSDVVIDLRDRLAEQVPDGVQEEVTGPAAVRADLAEVFAGADVRLLLATVAIVAVLLVITYRSPVLWLVPIIVVGVADRVAAILATQVLARLDVAWDESTVGILSVLVFGAGTNYALLLISRYRDELRRRESRHDAMRIALGRTAPAVLASATTVVLGVLTLLLSLTPTTRGLGLATAIGIVVAVFAALVVLPAALVLFGRWIFWPKVPRVGEPALVESTTSIWARIGRQVARRPAAFVVGSLVLLALLATGVLGVQSGLDTEDQFLDEPEAITALQRVGESFPAGLVDPARVVTADDDPQAVLRTISQTEGVSGARLTEEGNGVAQIEAVLAGDPGSAEVRDGIERLRDRLADFDDTHVTGTEAQALDENTGAVRDRTVILPLILVLVLGALLVLLRAPVAAVLLVLTVLATYVAALGASWWLFTGPLGFDALDNSTPLLSFLFLVALGVDYNIFLVTRAREEARRHGPRRGMLRALTATGGVITSAGIVLAAVFAVLGVLPLVVLAQIGTVICIGVLLDTLLVRTVLVPALALLLGDRFWWPRRFPDEAPAGDPEGAPQAAPAR
ncbi:MMPL family transporter [Nocardioides sp. zg-DK7169]|uniref:MMPL family transporter n=1 Tax=Nocardioides sp. zg-DK7169 TaxID=2736600 RepID=UPI001553A076|nr:MMPL family transporter [Nocardioides sp. zg-DK7169]NPC95863.1 MMPL family transporter [Nocardioides sp. zg-DK7169]